MSDTPAQNSSGLWVVKVQSDDALRRVEHTGPLSFTRLVEIISTEGPSDASFFFGTVLFPKQVPRRNGCLIRTKMETRVCWTRLHDSSTRHILHPKKRELSFEPSTTRWMSQWDSS